MLMSRQVGYWAIVLIILNGLFFSSVIPAFQSPDEFDHVKRAYFLTQGTIILEAPAGKDSGGMLDTGLGAYIEHYKSLVFKPDVKLTAVALDAANSITWTGVKAFSQTPGAGYYFPVIYVPQAIGLFTGEFFGLTVATSYQLARYCSLGFIAFMLFAAFRIYPVNPLALSFLFIPMTVYQFTSASLDGISIALSLFAISVFMRSMEKEQDTHPWLFYLALGAIALVVTSRVHLLPLLVLPCVTAICAKNMKQIMACAVATVFSGAWIYIAMTQNSYARIKDHVGASSGEVALFYVMHPWEFFDVLMATWTNPTLLKFYGASFIGILGWLDTPLPHSVYYFIFILILIIACLSVSVTTWKQNAVSRGTLLGAGIISVLLTFFALLIVWNPHPAHMIEGVQGRYLLVPFLMLAYALSGSPVDEGRRWAMGFLWVILLEGVTLVSMTPALLDRYYLSFSLVY